MKTTDQLTNQRRRSECYQLLAALFYPPERAQLLDDEPCRKLADVLDEQYPDSSASEQAGQMQDYLQQFDETQLKLDHAGLFVGPFALKAAPYGSVYLDTEQRLMGDSTIAAMKLYEDAGLKLELQEPADYISIELEFLHYLSHRAADAIAAGLEDSAEDLIDKQRVFLQEHLGAWFTPFCAAILKEAETPFFQALGNCLKVFLEAEMKHFSLEVPSAD